MADLLKPEMFNWFKSMTNSPLNIFDYDSSHDKLFEKLCGLLNMPEINKDLKFSDNSSRAKN